MTRFYSPSTGGFYSEALHDSAIPGDAVPVDDDAFEALMDGQAAGQSIVPDSKTGQPVLMSILKAPEDLRATVVRRIKAEAARRIEAVLPLHQQLNLLREGNGSDPRFALIDGIRTASNFIEEAARKAKAARLPLFPVSDNPLWPESDPA